MATTSPHEEDRLLTPDEAADRLRVTAHTLRAWERKRIGPTRTRVGPQLIRYRLSHIEQWLAEQQTDAGAPA